jgi:hypothetical protein
MESSSWINYSSGLCEDLRFQIIQLTRRNGSGYYYESSVRELMIRLNSMIWKKDVQNEKYHVAYSFWRSTWYFFLIMSDKRYGSVKQKNYFN